MLDRVVAARDRFSRPLQQLAWLGPLGVRLALGLVFLTAGWGKLHALDGVGAFFASLGIPAASVTAVLVSVVELVGGALLLLGLATRVAALLLAAVMAVAIVTAKLPVVAGMVELVGTLEVAYLAGLVWLAVSVGMCKHCRAYLRQLKATVGALGKMPETPMPEPIRDELRARFADWHARARKKSPGSP